MAATLKDLAQTIADLTDVVTDAADAQPGKPVHIDVLSGFNSALLAVAAGPLGVLLNTLLDPPALSVQYKVTRDGEVVAFQSTPPVDPNQPAKILDVALLLIPPFGEDTVATEPFHYQIDVILTVFVDQPIPPLGQQPTGTGTKTISIPVDMPAIPFPSVLLLGQYKNFALYDDDDDEAGSLIVMVRASSPARDLGAVVTTLNRVIGVVKSLQTFVTFSLDLISNLQTVANLIATAPLVYFSVGSVHSTDDLVDDDYGQAMTLIGVTDDSKTIPADNDGNAVTVPGVTQVTLFGQDDFSKSLAVEDAEWRTFSIQKVHEVVINAPGVPPIPTGVGFRTEDLTAMNWAATDTGEGMADSTNSMRWGGIKPA